MSGEHRRHSGWILPVIVVAVGAYFLYTAARRGALRAVALGPVGWVGLALMVAGAALALIVRRNKYLRLAGVLLCGAGAMMAIYG